MGTETQPLSKVQENENKARQQGAVRELLPGSMGPKETSGATGTETGNRSEIERAKLVKPLEELTLKLKDAWRDNSAAEKKMKHGWQKSPFPAWIRGASGKYVKWIADGQTALNPAEAVGKEGTKLAARIRPKKDVAANLDAIIPDDIGKPAKIIGYIPKESAPNNKVLSETTKTVVW